MTKVAISFVDILFIILLLRHDPEVSKDADSKPVADYLLTAQWAGPTERIDDIDTYVLTPWGEICFFRYKDIRGLVVLERDDLGTRNDQSPFNKEYVAFRNLPDGVYHVSIHNYRQDPKANFDGQVVEYEISAPGQTVLGGRVPMPALREERPIISFTVEDERIVHVTDYSWSSLAGEGEKIVGKVLR